MVRKLIIAAGNWASWTRGLNGTVFRHAYVHYICSSKDGHESSRTSTRSWPTTQKGKYYIKPGSSREIIQIPNTLFYILYLFSPNGIWSLVSKRVQMQEDRIGIRSLNQFLLKRKEKLLYFSVDPPNLAKSYIWNVQSSGLTSAKKISNRLNCWLISLLNMDGKLGRRQFLNFHVSSPYSCYTILKHNLPNSSKKELKTKKTNDKFCMPYLVQTLTHIWNAVQTQIKNKNWTVKQITGSILDWWPVNDWSYPYFDGFKVEGYSQFRS